METFSALLALCAGNSPVPVNSPHKDQWRGALMFSLIYVLLNAWVNNRETGDLRRHRAHYDVIVMSPEYMMAPWHRRLLKRSRHFGNTPRVTYPLWGESTGDRWTLTKASNTELWCFYPRPVLAFGYCRWLRLSVCPSVCALITCLSAR